MSKAEAASGPSPRYRAWLRHERRRRSAVHLARTGLLLVMLALWEVLPRVHVINPLLSAWAS